MNNKILTLLGFAAKAGKLSYGAESVETTLKLGKSKLILIACDISEKSRKEISFSARKNQTEVLILTDINIQTVSAAIGRKCGIISVNDKGFADSIKSMTGGNANDR